MLSALTYIDQRNIELWKQVSATFKITLNYHNEPNYRLYQINDNATIYVPHERPCVDSFSHELLHLWMAMKDVSVSCTISATFKTSSLLKLLFKPELGEHIGNCADHFKMLPLYLQMGFERELFISDFHKHKCSDTELSFIERWYDHLDFQSKQYATEQYLAKFFSMKSCPNPLFNYNVQLERLKAIDNSLFEVLQSFWDNFEAYDISKGDTTLNSYRLFTYPFTEDLSYYLAVKFSTR